MTALLPHCARRATCGQIGPKDWLPLIDWSVHGGELVQPWRVKICGVTGVDDAQVVAQAGADAIGFNFYAGSKRYLDPQTAAEIARSLPAGMRKVGVFVNASAKQIQEIAALVGLDLVQLHGDEPPEFLADVADRKLVRAFRCGPDGLDPILAYLKRCRQLETLPDAVLLDALDPQHYGGTGRTLDWAALIPDIALLGDLPWVLSRRSHPPERGARRTAAAADGSRHGERCGIVAGAQGCAARASLCPGGSGGLVVVSAACVGRPRVYHRSV